MTPQEIVDSLKEIKSKLSQIERENLGRSDAERLICEEFKVDECNRRREILALNHANIVSRLNAEIAELRKRIEESI